MKMLTVAELIRAPHGARRYVHRVGETLVDAIR
jgi:hypothetical protein